MVIDWQIRLGDLLSFLGFSVGGLSVIFLMKSDIRALGIRLGFLEDRIEEGQKKIDSQSAEIAKFGELLTVMGRYDERFIGIQRQLDSQQRLIDRTSTAIEDLKRGRGLIQEPA